MSTALDRKIVPLVLKKINQFGKAITLTAKTVSSYTVATGVVVSSAVNYSIKAVEGMYSERQIDGNIIKSGDKQIFIAASGLAVTPQKSDKGYSITMAGESWQIEAVKPVSSGDDIALYELQLRQ